MRLRQFRTPTFRARLRLFFVVIVIVPMITMAVVLFQLIVASERSQTDARLAEAQTVSVGVLKNEQAEAAKLASDIGGDQQLADAVNAEDQKLDPGAAGCTRRAVGCPVRRAADRRRRDVRGGRAAGDGAVHAAAGR